MIFDWDDTLFPTSWLLNNGINVDDSDDIKKFFIYFKELDNALLDLLRKSLTIGKVMIVTNANTNWIKISKKILFKTSQLIDKYIQIVSARDIYHDIYEMKEWKIHTFQKDMYSQIEHSGQIISFGDANYEFEALISLKEYISPNKCLKNIKLIDSPNFDILIDEINVISKSLKDICKQNGHMDLKFSDVQS